MLCVDLILTNKNKGERKMKNKKGFGIIAGIIFIIIIVIVAVSPILITIAYYNTAETIEVLVTDKEAIVPGQSSKYLIFTDKGVYECVDMFWKFKFDSSDQYSELKVGSSYTMTVYGWRIHFLSWYRNIYQYSKSNED